MLLPLKNCSAASRLSLQTLFLLLTGLSMFGVGCDAMQQATEAKYRSQSKNNLKQIGIGAHYFHEQHRGFPHASAVMDSATHPVSWETQILPFINQGPLYDTIDQNSSWDAPANRPAFSTGISTFHRPGVDETTNSAGYALNHYSANSQLFGGDKRLRFRDVTDGSANTFMAGEINAGYQPWGKPGNHRDPAAGLSGGPNNFGSQFNGGCHFLMCDGSVRFISQEINPQTLELLANPRDGQPVGGF